jgi:hypothetical protein
MFWTPRHTSMLVESIDDLSQEVNGKDQQRKLSIFQTAVRRKSVSELGSPFILCQTYCINDSLCVAAQSSGQYNANEVRSFRWLAPPPRVLL